jgi:NAD(P)-dependent dehydrogenase (short-subunit alcohol dehydrogenase family)
MGRLEGKVGFVTGGGTGLGLACAKALVEEGARVVLAGRRQEVLEGATDVLGSGASYAVCDVARDDSVDAAVSSVEERFGRLDLAVNAAGVGGLGNVLNATSSEFTATLDTNLTGVYRCLRREAQAMKPRGSGAIVNVHRWMTAYCVSKAGVNMLTRCAADDLGEHGIRVNAVMPGLVPTDLAAPRAEYESLMPLARLGTPEEVAALVAFLLYDDARWITGQCIGVDGGHTIRKGPDLVPLFREILPEER